ncbi:hypothetical protein [Pseudoxanthomonas beigongshangi]|uniref:hypothetical protein n=1 Tax=Pseudoxanthomonas beigongshangi TaxID=2782537 RepID=UPI00193B5D6B|nr:hypothetical protein [Pseudoxanthomonas beigongshangi]
MRHNLFVILLALASLTASADEPAFKPLTPAERSAALQSASTTGEVLYRHDQAAWLATDALVAFWKNSPKSLVAGWITQETEDGIAVVFVDRTPEALYRVTVSDAGVAGPVNALATPEPLSAYEAGAAAARAVAKDASFERCGERYNTITLPATDDTSGWTVYLIPGTTTYEDLPVGGAQRVSVKDGKIVSQRGYSRSCIVLKDDPKAVGLMITHLLDPEPTEIHVFWSLWAKKTFYVMTQPNGVMWKLDGKTIHAMDKD